MAVFPPDSRNKYDRCSTMARSRDFGGGYKSCSHWSNLWYPRKDSTRYPRRVGPIGRTLRVSKLPFKHLHHTCVRRRHAYTDASARCCGIFPVIANCHWSGSMANTTAWRNFDEFLDTQAVPHLDIHPLQDQPCSCTMEPCTPHTANTKDLLRRDVVGVLDWPSRSSDLNVIENL